MGNYMSDLCLNTGVSFRGGERRAKGLGFSLGTHRERRASKFSRVGSGCGA